MSADIAVQIKNLRFSYGIGGESPFGLDIDDLSIPSASVAVLVGENGSGKTTLLKIIAGLITTYAGSLAVMPRAENSRVLLHQEPYLLGGTVFHNVAYGLKIRGEREQVIRRGVAESLERVGLSGYEKKKAARLSGGERQRVSLARALAVRPKILLLDEPTTSVDRKNIELLVDLIDYLCLSGTTVVVTSHEMSFAYRICDEIHPLDTGRIAPFEQNVLKGTVERRDASFLHFKTGKGIVKCPEQDGLYSTAVIPFADVILSAPTIETSAQNQLPGVVTAVEKVGNRYRVSVDCGFPIRSYVTGYSIEHLHVTIGRRIFVIFKASAVKLY